jgi:hypothetical protein
MCPLQVLAYLPVETARGTKMMFVPTANTETVRSLQELGVIVDREKVSSCVRVQEWGDFYL